MAWTKRSVGGGHGGSPWCCRIICPALLVMMLCSLGWMSFYAGALGGRKVPGAELAEFRSAMKSSLLQVRSEPKDRRRSLTRSFSGRWKGKAGAGRAGNRNPPRELTELSRRTFDFSLPYFKVGEVLTLYKALSDAGKAFNKWTNKFTKSGRLLPGVVVTGTPMMWGLHRYRGGSPKLAPLVYQQRHVGVQDADKGLRLVPFLECLLASLTGGAQILDPARQFFGRSEEMRELGSAAGPDAQSPVRSLMAAESESHGSVFLVASSKEGQLGDDLLRMSLLDGISGPDEENMWVRLLPSKKPSDLRQPVTTRIPVRSESDFWALLGLLRAGLLGEKARGSEKVFEQGPFLSSPLTVSNYAREKVAELFKGREQLDQDGVNSLAVAHTVFYTGGTGTVVPGDIKTGKETRKQKGVANQLLRHEKRFLTRLWTAARDLAAREVTDQQMVRASGSGDELIFIPHRVDLAKHTQVVELAKTDEATVPALGAPPVAQI